MISKKPEAGFTLITMLVIMPFLLLISAIFLSLSVNAYKVSNRDRYHTHAQLATDAGLDVSVQELSQSDAWTGTTGEVELHNDGTIKTTYEVSVVDDGSERKIVTSTGRTYRPVGSTIPQSTVKVNMDLRAVEAGNYSIVSGVGGLEMKNSAKVVNGSVYINGGLHMTNTSQIGLSTLPVNVKVAHQTCPVPASSSYPRVCNSGENGEPISMNLSAHIYGEVRATNQTNGSGMSNTGLVTGSSEPPLPLPSYDRDAQKAAITSTIDSASASCSSGIKTWTGNLKITGDVSVTGTCVVTVEGNVWISGNLEVKNSAQIVVKSGLTAAPVIMIDGNSGLNMRNSSTFASNAGDIGFRIITYRSSASCSPGCSDVTGTDLFNSKSLITIDLDNTASGPETEFYARWSKITAGNSGSVGAFVGQTIELKNSAAVTFGTSVTGVGDIVWVIDGYKRVF